MSYKLLYCAILLSGIIILRNHHTALRVDRFNEYLDKFNKSYNNDEFYMRMLIFEESLKEIEHLNSAHHGSGASHGLTKFSDRTAEERLINVNLAGGSCTRKNTKCPSHKTQESTSEPLNFVTKMPVKGKLDWRDEDVIGPVQNQKQCNGCWAFSIVGIMESMAAIQGLGFEQLSIQELLDCSDVNKHCNGGHIDSALNLLCDTPLKITTEDKYPLLLINQKCQPHPISGRGLRNYTVECNVTDDYIKEVLRRGPVMVVINPSSWYNYVEGIITMNCPPQALFMSHVVQIVGYDSITDNDGDEVPYYIIRNSWGADWGENGYIRIAMGTSNLCGITNHVASLYVV